MCGGKIADVAANVIWKILIGSGQMKVKSRHVRASPKRMMFKQRAECGKCRSTLCLMLMLGAQECFAAWRCWRRCAGPRREQPGNKPHRCYLSYEIRDWCRKATPASPRCTAGHRRREHPRPSRRAAKRAAREVLPRCLRSTVYRVQPRLPFLRGSRRDPVTPAEGGALPQA